MSFERRKKKKILILNNFTKIKRIVCMFAPMLCIVATDSYKIDHHIGEQLIERQTKPTSFI